MDRGGKLLVPIDWMQLELASHVLYQLLSLRSTVTLVDFIPQHANNLISQVLVPGLIQGNQHAVSTSVHEVGFNS